MASTQKSLVEWGVLIKEEASYGAGGTLAEATDGVLVNERPDVDHQYVHEGARRGEAGPMGKGMLNVRKSGRFGTVTLVHEAAGGGAAYSASVKPSLHTLLKIAGFDATLVDTAESESYTYTLGSVSPTEPIGPGGVGEFYARQQKAQLSGILADLNISSDGPDIPVWEFPLSGMAELPTEASVPDITYPSVLPPKSESITLALGDFATAICRRFSLSLGRELGARADQNSGGHKGFRAGQINPVLEVEIEANSFVATPFHTAEGIDPYNLSELATAVALSLTVGSVKYNKWKISAPAAQLEPVDEGEDGPSALWTLRWSLKPSTPGAKDNLSILFD